MIVEYSEAVIVECSEAVLVEYYVAVPQTTELNSTQQRQRISSAFVVDEGYIYARYLSSKVIVAIVGLVFGNSTMFN